MSQQDEPLHERLEELEEKVEDCQSQLGEVTRKMDRVERMLLFLIERTAHRHVDGSLARDERKEIRALLRDTSVNVISHEDFEDESRVRGMELAFDHIYERLEEYGLGDVAQELRGE